MRPAEERLYDRPGYSRATGVSVEGPCCAPLCQQARRYILEQDVVPGIGVVAKSAKKALGFGGILEAPLRPIDQVKFQRRIDRDVVGRFRRLNPQGLALEFLLELARTLGRDLPGARPGRALVALAPAQPQGAFAPLELAGVPYFTLRALSRVPGINCHNHGRNPSGF